MGERDPKARAFGLLQDGFLGGFSRFTQVTAAAQQAVSEPFEEPRLRPPRDRARVRFGGGEPFFVAFFVLGGLLLTLVDVTV